jgi:hypothetical protein
MTTRNRKSAVRAESSLQVGCAWDDCFTALRKIKDLAHVPNKHSEALREACHAMRAEIPKMLEYGPVREGADDIRRLSERLARIVELANMMECGSLLIEVERAMEAAYKRMP